MPATNSAHSSVPPVRPTVSWVFHSPARIVAFGFGSGLLRPGPGTWGTALAWLLWVLVVSRFSDAAIGAILAISFAGGCWACQRVGKDLGRADDGGMVWDEVVAFWLVLWLTPDSWVAQLVAFAVFRAFDIIKPPPIHFFDARLKNGFGVMWDDLLAAAYSLLVIAILVRLEVIL